MSHKNATKCSATQCHRKLIDRRGFFYLHTWLLGGPGGDLHTVLRQRGLYGVAHDRGGDGGHGSVVLRKLQKAESVMSL